MKLQFTKMQGCGNDYVYIDGINQNIPKESKPELVRRLSDRHFGIGSDGVIFINRDSQADFEMEMYNADGSRSEMCGNGIRCVAKYVYDKGFIDRTEFDISSFGKVKHMSCFLDGDVVDTVRVDMGEPILKPSEIPTTADDELGVVKMYPVESKGVIYKMTCVSMGNPHAICYVDSVDDLKIEEIGPGLECHPFFPAKANIEFVENIDRNHIKMRVWERGTGETMACGTGSCALTVAGVLNDLTDREVDIELLGGTLHVEWSEKDNHVYMTGPARISFEGEIEV